MNLTKKTALSKFEIKIFFEKLLIRLLEIVTTVRLKKKKFFSRLNNLKIDQLYI